MGATCKSCCRNEHDVNAKPGVDNSEVVISKAKLTNRPNKETERFNIDNEVSKSDLQASELSVNNTGKKK